MCVCVQIVQISKLLLLSTVLKYNRNLEILFRNFNFFFNRNMYLNISKTIHILILINRIIIEALNLQKSFKRKIRKDDKLIKRILIFSSLETY